jgi:hypothetical protein
VISHSGGIILEIRKDFPFLFFAVVTSSNDGLGFDDDDDDDDRFAEFDI